MDALRKRPSKRRDLRTRRQLGLGRTQDLSDSSDSDSEENKRMRKTLKVTKEATDHAVSGRYAQPSSSFSKSTLKLHVNETATANSTVRMNSHLVYVGAAEGEDSNHIDIITSKEDCTDAVIFVSEVPELVPEGIAKLILNSNPTSSTSYHRPVSSDAACSTFECMPNNRSDTDSSVQPSACARSTSTAEPQEASEGTSNDEVLPDSLSDRARRCKSTGEAFSLPRYDQEDINTIEAKTRGQSENPLWFQYRIGCISASRFKEVASWKGSKRFDTNVLVKKIMGYTVLNPNLPNLVWGRTKEPVARDEYLQIMKSKGHESIQVTECGILFHPAKTFIGASPDGLVSCKSGCKACKREDERRGILEIKCPVKPDKQKPAPHNNIHLTQSARGRTVLNEQDEYYYQVQTQLAVTGLPWCDFFVYNHYGESFRQRIWPRLQRWNFDAIQAEQFFRKYIVPELVDKKLKNQMARAPVGQTLPKGSSGNF